MHGRVITSVATVVAILTLTLALPAFAQTSPTTSAYGGKQGDVLGNFDGGGQNDVVPPPAGPAGESEPTPEDEPRTPTERGSNPPPPPTVSKGELPFTGLEAGLVGLFGALLLGGGFAMRRASRDPS